MFLSELYRSAGQFGVWAYKIPDPLRSQFEGGAQFTERRPFDAMMSTRGAFIPIEAKVLSETGGRLELEEHQYAHLMRLRGDGHRAMIAVKVLHGRGKAKAYAVPIIAYYEYLTHNRRVGVPRRHIEVVGVEMSRIVFPVRRRSGKEERVGGWDIRSLVGLTHGGVKVGLGLR